MKKYLYPLYLVVFTLFCVSGSAQEDKSARPSPPAEVKGTLHGVNVTINYSTPAVKGRTIWGDLVPYGKVWRTGANEATIFETDKDLTVHDKVLPAGKYALFTIPGEKEWTWIFNAVWDQWGAYKYDDSKDVLRIQTVPQASSAFNERLRFEIADDRVLLYWDNLLISF
jgi:Protein of unknown function (DUF2911)